MFEGLSEDAAKRLKAQSPNFKPNNKQWDGVIKVPLVVAWAKDLQLLSFMQEMSRKIDGNFICDRRLRSSEESELVLVYTCTTSMSEDEIVSIISVEMTEHLVKVEAFKSPSKAVSRDDGTFRIDIWMNWVDSSDILKSKLNK